MNPNEESLTFKNLENDFPYKECLYFPIMLRSHDKFPLNVEWSCPRLSSDGKFIASICSNNSIYIWNSSNGELEKSFSTKEKILNFEFNPINNNLIVIFEDCSPKYLSIKSSAIIIINELKDANLGFNEVISLSFSTQGTFFALCVDKGLYIWDVITSELQIYIDDYARKKYLRNEFLLTITNNNFLRIIDINNPKSIFLEYNLKRVDSIDELQVCMITKDNIYLYYATNAGVFKLNIQNKLTDEVCKFVDPNGIIVIISDDCKKYMSTNMSDVYLYEERKGLVNKFTFEKFNYIRIDYNRMLLLIIDDISISLKNLELYGIQLDKCNVYTFQNPIKFQKILFTRNSENILGIVNENFAILYECSTGKIIKVFNNNSKVLYYENCLVLTPTTSENNYITFKLNDTSIYLYDSIKGIPLYIFKEFNAYEVKFNEGGNFLLAGTVGGNEVCRLWDLENPNQFYSYFINDTNKKNKNTSVCITNDRTKIICQSINQFPIIFDADSQQFLYEIKMNFNLSQIIGINCSNNSKHFIIIGKYNKKSICSIFEFNNEEKPNEINILDNCPKVHIPDKGNYFITEYISDNKKKGNKITIWKYIKDKLEKFDIEEKKGVQFDLLNDDKIISIISPSEEGKFGLIFHLYDSHTYKKVGDLEYVLNEKPNEFIYLDLTTDLGENIVLRKVSIQKES